MHADLLSRLKRSSNVLRDTAQMRTQLPEWLVIAADKHGEETQSRVRCLVKRLAKKQKPKV